MWLQMGVCEMKYSNFEDYLQEKYIQSENPLDDDIPDGFSEWLGDMDADDWLSYGDKYAAIVKKEV